MDYVLAADLSTFMHHSAYCVKTSATCGIVMTEFIHSVIFCACRIAYYRFTKENLTKHLQHTQR